MVSKKIKAIIGLGNKGEEYGQTYHNVGALAQDFFQAQLENTGTGKIAYFPLKGFMNQSGQAVKKFLKNHNLGPDSVLIIHDDSDIQLGEYKFSQKGSSGGHRGIANIIEELGTDEFLRLKIGIRDNEEKIRKKAGDFVLKKILKKDQKTLTAVFQKAFTEAQPIIEAN